MMNILATFSSFFLLINFGNCYDYCSEPLLYRASLSATSQLSGRTAEDARIDSGTSWSPVSNDFSEALFINLFEVKNITQIATKGRSGTNEFVKEYKISFGTNGLDYAVFKENDGNAKLFKGNVDGLNIHYNKFDTPIIAQFIRINPVRWGERISMRLELFGCDYESEALSFNGSSIIYKNLTQSRIQSTKDIIQFRFRTPESDGVIFYSHGTQGDYFALQLIRNKMVLNINLGSPEQTSITFGSLLDDGLWHDVRIERWLDEVKTTVDRVEQEVKILGDFQVLDLDRILYIGGVPNLQKGLDTIKNFTGCLENVYLNDTNVIYELANPSYYEHERFYSNNTLRQCPDSNIVPVTFTSSKSFVKLMGYQGLRQLNVSFDFRSFEAAGTLIFHKFSSPGFLRVYMDRGKILMDLNVEGSAQLTLDNFAETFNDGLWHSIEVTVSKNSVTLSVDGVLARTTKLMQIITGDVYYLAGIDPAYLTFNSIIKPKQRGLIGCVRQISLDGAFRNPKDFKSTDYCCSDSIIIDSCQMLDRCSPNPCEHNGICKQSSSEFHCDCEGTGYSGATCHSSLHPTSCQAYRNTHPYNQRADIMVDPDGSGPLSPFLVTCQYFVNGKTQTVIHHSSEDFIEVDGYQDPGSFVQDILYDGNIYQIEAVINRSSSCQQKIEYHCRQSRLFNTPYKEHEIFRPYGWWVSRQNQEMDYWGGAPSGSRKCECGVEGTCVLEHTWCNCDAGLDAELSDGGWLTEKEYLPVRELRFGDTGTLLDDKKGKFLLGPLICEGDSLYDNIVTFRLPDAALTFPTPKLGQSWDIYFEFKTTKLNAVFLHVKGPQDYIKVSLINGHLIQFEPFLSSQLESWTLNVKTSNRLNDDEWHSVLIEQNRKQSRILLDGAASDTRPQPKGHLRTIELTSYLFLGSATEFREGFVGCMRGITVNGIMLDVKNAVERQEYGVGMGCTGRCDSNPCLNNGTCIEGYNEYTCDCRFTAFKGPICADEIGVNMQSSSLVRYDFIGSYKSTISERLRVGFTTTEPKGFLVGLFSEIHPEYMILLVSNSGHLRLIFDFGFERQEIIYPEQNFATGQYHDVQITRANSGTKLIMKVDNLQPVEFTFNVKNSADAQFNNIQYLYLGRNETMTEGFIGCVSRVEFDDIYPLKYLFQENPPPNIRSEPPRLQEDFCGVEPVTHPPDIVEIRPPPDIDQDKIDRIYLKSTIESAVLGGTISLIFIALLIFLLLLGRYLSQHKGEYLTQEDEGAIYANDPNEAAIQGVTGHNVQVKREWYI